MGKKPIALPASKSPPGLAFMAGDAVAYVYKSENCRGKVIASGLWVLHVRHPSMSSVIILAEEASRV